MRDSKGAPARRRSAAIAVSAYGADGKAMERGHCGKAPEQETQAAPEEQTKGGEEKERDAEKGESEREGPWKMLERSQAERQATPRLESQAE